MQPFSQAPPETELDTDTLAAIRATLPLSVGEGVLPMVGGVWQDYLQHYGSQCDVDWPLDASLSITANTCAGEELVFFFWSRPHASASVCFFHGLFDHSGLFLPLVVHLLEQGFNVVTVDLPGMGLSSGPRAAIDSFSRYSEVVNRTLALARHQWPTLPQMLAGQSTGGGAIIEALRQSEIDGDVLGVVLLAPLIRPYKWPWVRLAIACFAPLVQRFPRAFTRNSHDEAFCLFLEKREPLQPRWLSMAWLRAMKRWIKQLEKEKRRWSQPVLIVQGTSDKTVGWQGNLPWLREHLQDAQVFCIEGAFHHLPRESIAYREEVFDAMVEFFHKQLQNQQEK